MDYTKVPRALIYKDRDDLKDFGVQTPGTMNYQLFLQLKQQALMGVSGAREVALRCYNNAYYVCTLILLEANDFPELRISDYVDKILEIEKNKGHIDEACLVSMAMVSLLLATYDKKRYGRDSDIWEAIYYRCTHYQWYHSSATSIFHNMMSGEYSIITPISYTEFAPRDILEVIENCSGRDLQVYAEYICERLVLLEDPRQQIHGADMAIARIKDYQRECCEDSGYNPEKDRFKYEDNNCFVSDLTWEKEVRDNYQQGNDAIDYYTKHYPKKEENDSKEKEGESPQVPETEVPKTNNMELDSSQPKPSYSEIAELQGRIKELQKALDEEIAKNAKLEEEIANRVQTNSDEYEKVKSRNEVLESLNEAAENRLKRYESILGTEEQLNKEKKFSIAERIIYCSALLGCSLSEDDISQMQMAKLIARFSGDKWGSIRTTISEMNGKRTALVEIAKKAAKEKDVGARIAVWRIEGEKFKGITNAALNVFNYLHAAVKGETIGAKVHNCQQAMENIDQAFYLSERKLIDRTYRQPEGEFELPPDEI